MLFNISSDDSITSGFIHKEIVVLGYTSGFIRSYHTLSGLFLEFSAHIRAVTSICLHQEEMMFASCSEDSKVNIYSFPRIETKHVTYSGFFRLIYTCPQNVRIKYCVE